MTRIAEWNESGTDYSFLAREIFHEWLMNVTRPRSLLPENNWKFKSAEEECACTPESTTFLAECRASFCVSCEKMLSEDSITCRADRTWFANYLRHDGEAVGGSLKTATVPEFPFRPWKSWVEEERRASRNFSLATPGRKSNIYIILDEKYKRN